MAVRRKKKTRRRRPANPCDTVGKSGYAIPHHRDGQADLPMVRKALVDLLTADIPDADIAEGVEHLEKHLTELGAEMPAVVQKGFNEELTAREMIEARAWGLGGTVYTFKANCKVRKIDDEIGAVFGWASVSEREDGSLVFDGEGDAIFPDELEKAAYDFNLDARQATDSHDRSTIGAGHLIESMVFTKDKQEALGIDVPVGWWVGFSIPDEEMRKAIRDDGERAMFSIGGAGVRVPV